MAAPNIDFNQILAALQKEMAQHENEKGMTDAKYQQLAMSKLIEKLQKMQAPQEAEHASYNDQDAEYQKGPVNVIDLNKAPQTKTNPIDLNADYARQQAPNKIDLNADYARQQGPNKIDLNTSYAQQQLPAPKMVEFPAPTPASISMPAIRMSGKAPASDEETLSEGALQALYALSKTAHGSSKAWGDDEHVAQTLDEHDMSGVDKLPYDSNLAFQEPSAPVTPGSIGSQQDQPRAIMAPLTERPKDEEVLRAALAALAAKQGF